MPLSSSPGPAPHPSPPPLVVHPGARRFLLPVAPPLTPADRKVVENVVKVVSFLSNVSAVAAV